MSTATVRRLEIGPGKRPLAGFETLELVSGRGARHVARWGTEPLPFAAGTFEEVYASHVLEHVPWNRTGAALAEVRRILRPEGTFEVWVPDFAYIVRCYAERRCGDDWRRDNPAGDPMLWVNGRIFTYGPGDDNLHRACFDEGHLRRCLERAGFVRVERIPARGRGTSHGPIDLGMRGVAP